MEGGKRIMNEAVFCKGFVELTAEESLDINGGGIFGSILSTIDSIFGQVINVVGTTIPIAQPIANTVYGVAQSIFGIIRTIAGTFGAV
jgi:hypothetical protein